jgi:hypothetical protein
MSHSFFQVAVIVYKPKEKPREGVSSFVPYISTYVTCPKLMKDFMKFRKVSLKIKFLKYYQ